MESFFPNLCVNYIEKLAEIELNASKCSNFSYSMNYSHILSLFSPGYFKIIKKYLESQNQISPYLVVKGFCVITLVKILLKIIMYLRYDNKR